MQRSNENGKTENSVETVQLVHSKMAEAGDGITTAHEVCKYVALKYVYELDNCH